MLMITAAIFVPILISFPLKGDSFKLHFHGNEKKIKYENKEIERIKECSSAKYMAADIAACMDVDRKEVDIERGYGDTIYDSHNNKRRQKRVAKHWLKWPKHSTGFVYVPYKFSDYVMRTPNITEAFLQGVDEVQRSSCIRFIPKQLHHTNYVEVIDVKDGCYSLVGMVGGRQPLQLQAHSGCATKGVAIHEILHALGFMHEMLRRDRNKYITIHYENIPPRYYYQFDMHPHMGGSVFGEPYDVTSIMHYGNYAFGKDKDKPTITSVRNRLEKLGQRDSMSTKDKIQLNRMYKCEKFITRV